MDLRFKLPFSLLLAGPSGSGKTTFVHRLLLEGNEMLDPFPDKIVYIYEIWQNSFEELKRKIPQIIFVEGLPNDLDDVIPPNSTNTLLLLDDMMTHLKSTENVIVRLFTISRHKKISVCLLVQDLFYSKQLRTVSINANFIALFRSTRDRLQVMNLAKQMYPGETKFLLEAFVNATAEPYGYLLLDLRPTTPEQFRVRTNIFPGEKQFSYVRKDYKSK